MKKIQLHTLIIVFLHAGCLLHSTHMSGQVTAQEKLPDLIGKYLVEIHEIKSAIYDVSDERIAHLTSNYYIHTRDTFRLVTTELIFVEFGGYITHIRPHFGMINTRNIDEHCFIDCLDIQSDLKRVFDFFDTLSVKDEMIRTRIIKKIIALYPVHVNNWKMKLKNTGEDD